METDIVRSIIPLLFDLIYSGTNLSICNIPTKTVDSFVYSIQSLGAIFKECNSIKIHCIL